MIRLGGVFWVILVCAVGFLMFKVKYEVQELEEELSRVRKATVVEQQEMHVLNAEWSLLNQPARLEEMNRRYLSLVPIGTKQIGRQITDLPLRPAPPAQATADIGGLPDPLAALATPSRLPTGQPVMITTGAAAPGAGGGKLPGGIVPAVAKAPDKNARPRSLDDLIAQLDGSGPKEASR